MSIPVRIMLINFISKQPAAQLGIPGKYKRHNYYFYIIINRFLGN